MVAMLDFLKIGNMDFCCIIIKNFHAKNGKDLYFSCKLSIIITITADMLDFLKIWNIDLFLSKIARGNYASPATLSRNREFQSSL